MSGNVNSGGLTRKQFDQALWDAQELNAYAVAVLKAYASRNSYEDEVQETYPAQAWVAKESHINKDTVKDYVDALVEDGWLLPARMHGRAQGYFLARGVVRNEKLQKAQRGRNLKKKRALSPDGQEKDAKPNVLIEPDQSPHGAAVHVLMEPDQSPDGQELTTKNIQEEEPSNNIGAVAPVETKGDEPFLFVGDSPTGPESSLPAEGDRPPVDASLPLGEGDPAPVEVKPPAAFRDAVIQEVAIRASWYDWTEERQGELVAEALALDAPNPRWTARDAVDRAVRLTNAA